MHGQAHSTEHHLDTLLNNGNRKGYYRFDAELVYGSDDMDDASDTNTRALEQLAHEIIVRQSDSLDTVASLL
jgi:hypothetical protein